METIQHSNRDATVRAGLLLALKRVLASPTGESLAKAIATSSPSTKM
jgi:hypothetical protein